jgi:hypothetical protein
VNVEAERQGRKFEVPCRYLPLRGRRAGKNYETSQPGRPSYERILEQVPPVRFQVLTKASTKMAVFWVVAPCSLVDVYQRPDDGGSKHL